MLKVGMIVAKSCLETFDIDAPLAIVRLAPVGEHAYWTKQPTPYTHSQLLVYLDMIKAVNVNATNGLGLPEVSGARAPHLIGHTDPHVTNACYCQFSRHNHSHISIFTQIGHLTCFAKHQIDCVVA
jgi:hypothetical protein